MPQFQLFQGPEEKFAKTLECESIEKVIDTLDMPHQYYFTDVIDESALYIKELIWDFKEWVMSEKTLYFVAQKKIELSEDVKQLLSKNETVKRSWFDVL